MEIWEPGEALNQLFAAAELRAESRELTEDHTQRALTAYSAVAALCPELEPAGRGAMVPLGRRVCADARELAAAMRGDPAAPMQEDACRFIMAELSNLAAVYVTVGPAGGAPDPDDEYAGEYRAVCARILDLMAATAEAQPTWRFLREGRAAARARPPPRRRGAPRGHEG